MERSRVSSDEPRAWLAGALALAAEPAVLALDGAEREAEALEEERCVDAWEAGCTEVAGRLCREVELVAGRTGVVLGR